MNDNWQLERRFTWTTNLHFYNTFIICYGNWIPKCYLCYLLQTKAMVNSFSIVIIWGLEQLVCIKWDWFYYLCRTKVGKQNTYFGSKRKMDFKMLTWTHLFHDPNTFYTCFKHIKLRNVYIIHYRFNQWTNNQRFLDKMPPGTHDFYALPTC